MPGPDLGRLHAASQAVPEAGLTIQDLLGQVPGATLPWLVVLCTIPAAIPGVQLGWVSVPLMLVMARAMAAGRRRVRLPQRIAATRVGQANARRLLNALAWTARTYERWCRPRGLQVVRLVRRRPSALLVGLMALVILLPIPGGNFLPAVAVVLLMGGLLRRDGYAIIAAGVTALAAIVVAIAIVLVGWKVASHMA